MWQLTENLIATPHSSTYMTGPLYRLFKSQVCILPVATQVTTITASLLKQTGWNTTDFQGKSGPLLFPYKLISIVLGTHISGCATSIHLWVSV